MQRGGLILVVLVAVIAVALFSTLYLSNSLSDKNELPELVINLNQDKCHRCGMLISDRQFAAAILLKGERDFRKYDNIGCMLAEYGELDKGMVISVIVHDYNSGQPLRAANAWFVVATNGDLVTPMGYGVVALGNQEDAQKIAKRYSGEVIDWESLVKYSGRILSRWM